jgi:SynChlorMet cassette protein ScmC
MLGRFAVTLHDGTTTLFEACGDGSSAVIERLARAFSMQLEATEDSEPDGIVASAADDGNGAECARREAGDGDLGVRRMIQTAQRLVDAARERGGVLVHGALAALDGTGAILAAPGGGGKSTASARLSAPWRSLSDDQALIVRDADGSYWAHPWPTWSRFFDNGPGGSWPVEEAVALAGIAFLQSSDRVRITPIGAGRALCLLVESAEQAAAVIGARPLESEVAARRRVRFENLAEIVKAVPCFVLESTLDGAFWRELEAQLGRRAGASGQLAAFARPNGRRGRRGSVASSSLELMAFDGPSMRPTLAFGDLLETESVRRVQPGDVVVFRSQAAGGWVVHRVRACTPAGLITRGDDNSEDDERLVADCEVAARVVAAWRGDRRRQVRGGPAGRALAFRVQLVRFFQRAIAALWRRLSRYCRLRRPRSAPDSDDTGAAPAVSPFSSSE